MQRATVRSVDRGPHHRLSAEGVDVQHRDAEPREVRGRAPDRVRDVVELGVEEHRRVPRDAPNGIGPARGEQLQSDLQQTHRSGQGLGQLLGLVGVGAVDRDDQWVVSGGDRHELREAGRGAGRAAGSGAGAEVRGRPWSRPWSLPWTSAGDRRPFASR